MSKRESDGNLKAPYIYDQHAQSSTKRLIREHYLTTARVSATAHLSTLSFKLKTEIGEKDLNSRAMHISSSTREASELVKTWGFRDGEQKLWSCVSCCVLS